MDMTRRRKHLLSDGVDESCEAIMRNDLSKNLKMMKIIQCHESQ